MFDLCIKNGLIVNAGGSVKGDVYIKDGIIGGICTEGEKFESREIIDAAGTWLFPGFVDPHSHLNDPGLTDSEDFYTGTCSAAAGGITTVMEHPLTIPVVTEPWMYEEKKNIADSKCVVDFALFGACVPGNYQAVREMTDMGAVAFKAFLTISPDMPASSNMDVIGHMENLKGLGPVMPIHCEDQNIIDYCVKKLRAEGHAVPEYYNDARPEIAEAEAINRMALFAEYTGGKVHIVHCSTPKGIDIVNEYRAKGADISVETCAHFLVFDENTVKEHGIYAVCNPPIRNRSTVEKMWTRVLAGDVAFVGSDHANYTFSEKEQGREDVFNTPAGLTGIQTCFPAFFSEAMKRGMPPELFAAMTSTNAAKRYSLYPRKGQIAVGSDADITIINPDKEWTVELEKLMYKEKWSPYVGMKLKGKIEKTIVRGTVVFENDSICVEPGYGEYITRIDG